MVDRFEIQISKVLQRVAMLLETLMHFLFFRGPVSRAPSVE